MPANTWTPTALTSEARSWQGSGWRAVEAQHKNATMSLAHGDSGNQKLLEGIIEEVKPRLPPEAERLHWLLATPFRYRPPPPYGSRFRRREDAGVFYGAEDRKTAAAEAGYWRLRLWLDSEGLRTRAATVPMTLFEFHAHTDRLLDLSSPPLSADRTAWTNPADYTETQALADQARVAEIVVIRYESVRNPDGRCLAIMTPKAFSGIEGYRHVQQGWSLLIEPTQNLLVWQRELGGEVFSFRF